MSGSGYQVDPGPGVFAFEDLWEELGRPSEEALQTELDEREIELLSELAIRPDGLPEFVQLMWGVVEPRRPLVWGWHMGLICDALMASYDDRDIRHELVTNIPPRHTKSLLVSVLGPAWRWLRAPEEQFLCFTKADKNVRRDARLMRRVVNSPQYQRLKAMLGERWGWSPDQNELGYFANTAGGHRISLTTNSDVTGANATVIVIDDPHDVQDTIGDPVRVAERMAEVVERYGTVWARRLTPPGGRVHLIMQRLHEADLAGHMLDKAATRRVVLPFVYEADHEHVHPDDPREEGEILAPGRFGPAELADAQEDPQVWAGQMQQRPRPKEGGLFKEAWFEHTYTPAERPFPARVVVSVDATFKGGPGSDFCVIGVLLQDRERPADIFVDEVRRGRWDYPQLRTEIREVVAQLRSRYPGVSIIVLVEDKANGSAVIADLQGEVPNVVGFEPGTRSKFERAQVGSVPRLQAGQVRFLAGASWLAVLVDEHLGFPRGRHDDIVDMLSQGCIHTAQHPLGALGQVLLGGRRRDLSEGDPDDGRWRARMGDRQRLQAAEHSGGVDWGNGRGGGRGGRGRGGRWR